MYHKALIILLVFVASNAFSQTKFIERFTVRKSFQSKADLAAPAHITFSQPKEKSASWMVDAALGYSLLNHHNTLMSVMPFVEYHRNTLIDKAQNHWQVGISSEWQINNLSQKSWSPVFVYALRYSSNQIQQHRAFQGNVYVTPIFKKKDMNPKYFWIPNHVVGLGNRFRFVYTPYLGFESENRINTESYFSYGNIYRAYARISSDLSFFPTNNSLKGKFDLNLDWQYRYNIHESAQDISVQAHQYFTTSFNYTFFTSADARKIVKIGFDYTTGEDPTKGFEKQSFYAILLKVKLSIAPQTVNIVL